MVEILCLSILVVGPRVWGCCVSVGEFASGCRQGLQLAFYPKCNPVDHLPRKMLGVALHWVVFYVLCFCGYGPWLLCAVCLFRAVFVVVYCLLLCVVFVVVCLLCVGGSVCCLLLAVCRVFVVVFCWW